MPFGFPEAPHFPKVGAARRHNTAAASPKGPQPKTSDSPAVWSRVDGKKQECLRDNAAQFVSPVSLQDNFNRFIYHGFFNSMLGAQYIQLSTSLTLESGINIALRLLFF